MKKQNHEIPVGAIVWTRHDVAKACQVSLRTVGKWIAERRIPVLKLGKAVRFSPDAVAAALAKYEVKAVAK